MKKKIASIVLEFFFFCQIFFFAKHFASILFFICNLDWRYTFCTGVTLFALLLANQNWVFFHVYYYISKIQDSVQCWRPLCMMPRTSSNAVIFTLSGREHNRLSISNSNWTEWSTIHGEIRRVISNQPSL